MAESRANSDHDHEHLGPAATDRHAGPAFALVLVGAMASAACDSGSAFDWPVARDSSPPVVASTFGPRVLGGFYDFHRGLDILTTLDEPILAIKAGEVLVAGDDPDYQPDTVVLAHCGDMVKPARMDDCDDPYYTHYSHLSNILVTSGEPIERGARVGLSGQGESGIAHVHFEIRSGGSRRSNAIHPLRMLPYVDNGPPAVTILDEDFSDPAAISVRVSVSVSAQELDVARVEVALHARADGALLSSQIFDLEEWNRTYSDTADLPTQGGVTVEPIDFDRGHPAKEVRLHFDALATDVPREDLRIVARVTDVMDNVAEDER